MTCEQCQDLIFLYVADQLSGEESEPLREHLSSGCPACAGYLAEAQSTLAAIPLALDTVGPSLALKKRLMARIAAAESGAASRNSSDPDRLPDTLILRVFRTLIPAGIAAALAIVFTHAVVSQRYNALHRHADELQSMLSATTLQVDTLRSQLSNQKQVMEMLASPQLKLVQLDGGKLQPNALAHLLWDQKNNHWLLQVTGMNPAPPGKCYELWYITADSKKIRADVFEVDSTGSATLKTTVPPNLGPLAMAAVTDEPAGGDNTPTGNIQLAAKLQ